MKNKYAYIVIIFLIVASLAAFSRIAFNDFIDYDDGLYVTAAHHSESGFNYESIKWAMVSSTPYYWHPLTWLSHMLDWSLFGANATGHHLVSLFLHIGAVVFLFLFLFKATNDLWPSAFAAAFFALHPLRVESVAWAAERKDVLSMFFGMATLWAYSFYVENLKPSKYILCLILFTLALMSKPMMVTLPFVLLLLDYWPLHRWQRAWDTPQANRTGETVKLIVEKIPFILLTVAASFLTLRGQTHYGAVASLDVLPFSVRADNAVFSYASYLWKMFWPSNLAIFYPYDLTRPLCEAILSSAVLAAVTLTALYYMKRLPFLFAGWFMYVGTLIPMIGLLQVGMQAMADRHTYLPSVGIALVLAWGISSVIKSEVIRRKIIIPLALVVLMTLSIMTWRQCGYWKDSITVFSHAVLVTNNNDRAHNNLGYYFLKAEKINQAIYHFSKAIAIAPNDYGSYNNRGLAYSRIGKDRQAIDDYTESIRLKPDYIDAYYNRGTSYGKTGDYQLAFDDFNKVISLEPAHVKAYNNRGIVYTRFGSYANAIDDFSKALNLQPDYVDAFDNRAFAYFNQGDIVSGCRDSKTACAMGTCNAMRFAQSKGFCR